MRRWPTSSKTSRQRSIHRNAQCYTSKMADERTDNELLLSIARSKDKAAFAELFQRYLNRSNALSYHITGEQHLAEEATQEGLLKVWISAHTFRPEEGEARKWIFCVVANAANQIMRKRKHDKARVAKHAKTPSRDSGSDHSEGTKEEVLEVLRQQTLCLPEKERQLLSLYYGAGLKQDEISKMLSIPQRTVSHKLKQALDVLRGHLSRAGFAGALTPFSEALYQEALLSGPSLRVNASREMMQALDRAIRASRTPEKPLYYQTRIGIGVFLGSCALLGLVAYALLDSSEQDAETGIEPSPLKRTNQFEPVVNGAQRSSQDLVTWVFDPENKPPVKVRKGIWHRWLPRTRKQRPGVLSPNGNNNAVVLGLPVKISSRPFVVKIHARVPGREHFSSVRRRSGGIDGLMYSKEAGGVLAPASRWILKNRFTMTQDQPFVESIYVKGGYQVQISDALGLPLYIMKITGPTPRGSYSEFLVRVYGYIIEKISYQSFTEETFPLDAEKWESWTLHPEKQSHLKNTFPR